MSEQSLTINLESKNIFKDTCFEVSWSDKFIDKNEVGIYLKKRKKNNIAFTNRRKLAAIMTLLSVENKVLSSWLLGFGIFRFIYFGNLAIHFVCCWGKVKKMPCFTFANVIKKSSRISHWHLRMS